MKTIATIATIAVVTLPLSASAENKSLIAKRCLTAIEAGDTAVVQGYADDIRGWKVMFGPKLREDAEACLFGATGEAWTWSEGKFAKTAEVKAREIEAEQWAIDKDKRDALETQRRIDAAHEKIRRSNEAARVQAEQERAEAEKRRVVMVAAYSACVELYHRDRTTALTNKICLDFFLETGLPNA